MTNKERCDCGDYPNGPLRLAADCPTHGHPLFVPLKTQYFEAFKTGTKNVEYRRYGRGWNEQTCRVGRPVVLSKGYGKYERLHGVVTSFDKRWIDNSSWIDCYGEPDWAACIGIKVLP